MKAAAASSGTSVPRGMRVLPALGLALAVALTRLLARADGPAATSKTGEARAEARFREASQAFDEGRMDEACAGFEESLRLFPKLGTLLNLALCHEKQGKTASAWLEFTHASAQANDAALQDRREFAHQHALRLERTLSRIAIEPADARVRLEIDGVPIGEDRRALPLFLDPGPHVIAAIGPGGKRYESTVTVPVGASSQALSVKIPSLQEGPNRAAGSVLSSVGDARSASPVHPSSRRTAGWILGSAGVVTVGVAAYFGIDSLSKMSSLPSVCPGGCDTRPAQTAEVASLVAFGTGIAALAAGTWLVLSTPPIAASSVARIYVVPHVTTESAGFGISGAW